MSIIYDYYEMLQYIIVLLIISFFAGLLIDNIFYIKINNSINSIYSISINSEIIKKDIVESDVSTEILILNIFIHIITLVISVYYIKKIIYLFPNKNNYKIDIYTEIAMIYISIQTNFYNKITLLKKRLF
jgi:predicted Na+-dependent transporter